MQLEALIEVCREAGDAARALHGGEVNTKNDGSPVTAADLRSNEILVSKLAADGIPIISEEIQEIPPHESGRAWIIDPLDGTRSFIVGDPGWAVMVGLVEDGLPVMGVVYAPEMETLWYAQKGAGAFMERDGSRTRMSVSSIADPHEATILISIQHPSKLALAIAKDLRTKQQQKVSGLGVRACLVAGGSAELYWTAGNLGEWDICAPHIIVEEAGGSCTDALGKQLRYGSQAERSVAGVAVSNSALHEALIEAGKTALGSQV